MRLLAPGAWAGVVTEIVVGLRTAALADCTVSKRTVEPLTKFVPVTVRVVRPSDGPLEAERFVMVGTGAAVKVVADAFDAVPPPMLVMVTSTVPAA